MAPQATTPPPAQATPDSGMTFDAAPTSTAITVPPPAPPASNATDGGMVFDTTPTATALTVPDATQQQQMPAPQADAPMFPQGTVSALPNSTTTDHVKNWANAVSGDLRYGTGTTVLGSLLRKLGATGLQGGVAPGVADFMGSLPLGLLRATKGSAELTQSGQRWTGTKDMVGGLFDAATIPSGFVAPEGGEVAGQASDALATQAGRAASAVKAPFSVKAIQPHLQDSIITAIRDTAKEHGIALPDAASVRDIAQTLSDGVRAKAHGIYQQLDSALGGTRFQAWDEQLGNIQRAMRDSLGIDPEKDAALAQRLQDVTAARNAAMDTIRGKGLDPDNLIGQADRLHQRAMALQDVSKAVRSSTDVHPSMASEGEAAPANVKTAPLFKRLNGLATPNPKYPGTPSRLVQALGQDRADALLHAVDASHLYAQKIAARNKMLGTIAKATGLGGLGYEAVSGIHHLLGGDGQ